MKMIALTGAGSPLGRCCVEVLLERTDCALLLLHSPRADRDHLPAHSRVKNFVLDLEQPLDAAVRESLGSVDRLFHFAWLRGPDAVSVSARNRGILARLLEALAGPERLFLISSVAGTPHTKSAYGRGKYEALQLCEERGARAALVGLVTEPDPVRGPYRLLRQVARRLPFAFRIRGPVPPVFPVQRAIFAEAMLRLALDPNPPARAGVFEAPIDFNRFMTSVEAHFPRRRLTLRCSARTLLGLADAGRRLRIVPAKLCDQVLTFFYKDSEFLLGPSVVPYAAAASDLDPRRA